MGAQYLCKLLNYIISNTKKTTSDTTQALLGNKKDREIKEMPNFERNFLKATSPSGEAFGHTLL